MGGCNRANHWWVCLCPCVCVCACTMRGLYPSIHQNSRDVIENEIYIWKWYWTVRPATARIAQNSQSNYGHFVSVWIVSRLCCFGRRDIEARKPLELSCKFNCIPFICHKTTFAHRTYWISPVRNKNVLISKKIIIIVCIWCRWVFGHSTIHDSPFTIWP